jgi:hypothetical protein
MGKDDAEGAWVVAQGEYNGRPLFARINTAVRRLAGDPRYGHRVGVAVPLRRPSPEGLPGAEESAELGELEEKLVSALTAAGTTLFVLAITTSGMREFVFYTSEPASVEPCIERLAGTVGTHELQLVVAQDPEWIVFRQFADSLDVA